MVMGCYLPVRDDILAITIDFSPGIANLPTVMCVFSQVFIKSLTGRSDDLKILAIV